MALPGPFATLDPNMLAVLCATGLFWIPLYKLRGKRASLVAIKQDTLIRFGPWVENIPMTPNQATFMDLVVSFIGAFMVMVGQYEIGAIMFLAACGFDALDGLIARAKHIETQQGALLDFATDRVSEFLIILAVTEAMLAPPALAITALFAGTFIAFNRVHAQALDMAMVDITRTPRRELLAVGLLAGATAEAMGAIAITGCLNGAIELATIILRTPKPKTEIV